ELSCVNAGENRGLSRCTLRQPLNAESRVSFRNLAIERKVRIFTLEYREELRFQPIKRIMCTPSSYSNAVDEDEENGRRGDARTRRRGHAARGRGGDGARGRLGRKRANSVRIRL